jgi:hypothetical protein
VEAGSAAGRGAGAGGSSPSNALTGTHRMTLDEAKMILNLKNDISLAAQRQPSIHEQAKKELEEHYERLFTINAPPAPKGKTGGGSGSFYVQSKIVRARERIEAEWKMLAQPEQPTSSSS